MKLVINKCYGGFGLSHECIMRYGELAGIKLFAYINFRDEEDNRDSKKYIEYHGEEKNRLEIVFYFTKKMTAKQLSDSGNWGKTYWSGGRDTKRDDPFLVQAVEELGDKANGGFAKLRVIEIPDGVEYEIDEYDGIESVHEKHEVWG